MTFMAAGILALVQAAGPAQFAVIDGRDTTWVQASNAIQVEAGQRVQLATVVYDEGRNPLETGSVWWHGGDDAWMSLDREGVLVGKNPGEVEVMFHWTTPEGDGDMVWVTIEVVAKAED